MRLKEPPKQIKIEVTQTDIRLGEKGNPWACAIARAVKRTMGDHPAIETGGIFIDINGLECQYNIPKKADEFIHKFDEDKKTVKPFSFVAKYEKNTWAENWK